MQTQEWTFLDRSKWQRGTWDYEPIDKKQWRDDATGLPCLIHRNRSGAWCGYVGVTEGHPAFEHPYSQPYELDDDGNRVPFENTPGRVILDDIDIHGGLTYDGFCQPHGTDDGRGVCHVVEDGEDDRVWWFGFDCAHSWDVLPFTLWPGEPLHPMASYMSQRGVELEVEKLALQLSVTSR